jgi:uncharacterized protein with von Willebrand factor type A (vWA) domain
MIIVMDSSGSIGEANYQIALQFVANLSAAFTASSRSRLGFNLFSYKTQTIIPITNSLSRDEIQTAILSSPYLSGGTRTDLGVKAALKDFQLNARPGVPRTLVVLTDGMSEQSGLTSQAAASAKEEGLRMFSIGITSGVNDNELVSLAGGDELRTYKVYNWEDLAKLLTQTSMEFCPVCTCY